MIEKYNLKNCAETIKTPNFKFKYDYSNLNNEFQLNQIKLRLPTLLYPHNIVLN